IGNAVGLQSSSTVHGHLAKLEDKGYIRRDPTKPRAIEIVQTENQSYTSVIQVPVLGKVTAGLPITAVENVDEYFPLPEHFTANHNSEIFRLNVAGDSMIDAGIFDGDRVIVRKQNIAHNGDNIVRVTRDDDSTVKWFYKDTRYFRLQSEYSGYNRLYLGSVIIYRKVIGMFIAFSHSQERLELKYICPYDLGETMFLFNSLY